MTKTVDFAFDVISPAAYVAWHILPKIAAKAGAEIHYIPMFLGGLMQATGNRPPMTVPNKGKWMQSDLPRWMALYGLDYRRNEVFPQNTLPVMRGAVAYQDQDVFRPMLDRIYRAMHVENAEIQDPEVLAGLLREVGLDPAEVTARIGDPAVKERLKTNTETAAARGAFGAPTFWIGETMHWGQDRLFMVAEDLGVSIHEALGD